MPWTSGSFTRVGGTTHWVDDKNAAINIVASRHDTNDEDLASGINFCLNRDGTSKPTGEFLPAVDNTQNLGNSSFRWASLNGLFITNGTFTVTLTGCTTAPTGTATWARFGSILTLTLPALSATSNSNALTYTGLPVAIQPNTLTHLFAIPQAINNGVLQTVSTLQIQAISGTIVMDTAPNGGGWVASGTKGLTRAVTVTYLIA